MDLTCAFPLTCLKNLGFGKCSLSVQAPVRAGIKSPADLAGKRIVTSFPNITKKFFQQFDTEDKQTSEFSCRVLFSRHPALYSPRV